MLSYHTFSSGTDIKAKKWKNSRPYKKYSRYAQRQYRNQTNPLQPIIYSIRKKNLIQASKIFALLKTKPHIISPLTK